MSRHAQYASVSSSGRRNTPASHSHLARLVTGLIVTLAACAVPVATAWGENPALDEAFQQLTTLQPGQGLEMLRAIEQAVVLARTDEAIRRDLEIRLIAAIQGDATDLAKDYACRQMVLVGRAASVPALAQLLPNARLSYMARYALEGIGSPEAIGALRAMLEKTDGGQQVGVVIALGRLADGGAVPQLAALLTREDEELREAILVALGRIATVPAADALRGFANQAPAALKDVVVAAELDAAEGLCREGAYQAAIGLCEPLLTDDSERVRAAALRRLIAAKPTESLAMIVAGLAAEESWKRAVAADCVVALEKPEEIQTIAAAVASLPVPGRIAALVSLKDCSNPVVREAALRSLNQADKAVRTTALEALIASGTAEDVATLADLAATADDLQVRHAAFETLRLMNADGTNAAIIDLLNTAGTLNPVMVKCALARRCPEFVPAFLKAAESSDSATRLEAFKALEIMATEQAAQALAGLLCRTSPGEEREAADRAVWMSCQKIVDPAQRSAPLLSAMETVDESGRCAILPTLARIGGERSLTAVHTAMTSNHQALRDAGYRALANWPDATVADELLEIAQTGELESYRVWSLRAYARVVTLANERPPQRTFEMLRGAMKLATRTEDKEFIISRLGSVRVPEALALLLALLDDDELKNSAVPAVFALAKGLSQAHPEQARAALERIQPMTTDAAILQQIPKVLRDIDARQQEQEK